MTPVEDAAEVPSVATVIPRGLVQWHPFVGLVVNLELASRIVPSHTDIRGFCSWPEREDH
jgi:hypothetical protein